MLSVRIVRLGTARGRNEGTRIGTVRHPPRGVPKDQHAAQNWYDAWLPELAPSSELVKLARSAVSEKDWAAFVKRYRSEMAEPEKQRLLELLATMSRTSHFSVGCYCADESRCHRSVLRELLRECGAELR
jgi:uncharacterized protein YeaO (DUF488 family)